MLSASKYNLISAQSSTPSMCIVQDSLLGAYKMTTGIKTLRKDQFCDIALRTGLSTQEILRKMQHIRKIFKQKGKKAQCYHGKGLVSLLLPDDFIYEKENNGDPNEPTLKIYRGVLYEGAINKAIIGPVGGSIIQILNKEYGPDRAAEFIDGIQFITHGWLLIEGFSIGIGDCVLTNKEKEAEIRYTIKKCLVEAEGIEATTNHPGIREVRIYAALSKAKDIGNKIAKDSLDPNNNFLSTVQSGSKGDWFNITAITGLLAQQNLQGKRIKQTLNNGKRTLPHYPFENLTMEMKYESRGFVDNSFIHGLNPRQYYFHAMSGRESCCDTAMNTSVSGYIQRRIIKLTEDIKTQYDGTVRDNIGTIYQGRYGDDGFDPRCTLKVKGSQEPCDISRIVNRLNMQHEVELEEMAESKKKRNTNTEVNMDDVFKSFKNLKI